MATTTNYGWTKPTVGGSIGSWGTENNAAWDAADASLKVVDNAQVATAAVASAAQTTANAALPKAGGTMTGNIAQKTETNAVQSFTGTGTKTIDCSLSNVAEVTSTSGNITFAFSNVPAAIAFMLLVRVTTSGAHTVSWPAAVKWSAGAVPAQTASGTDVYQLFTTDGGTTWRAARVMRAVA